MISRSSAAALPALLVCALLGCGDSEEKAVDASTTSSASAGQQVGSRQPLRPGCGLDSVGGRLVRFAAALNAADTDELKRFWGDRFVWFSITNSPAKGHRQHFLAKRPRRALAYVRAREGFAMSLNEIAVGGGKGRTHSVEYVGTWSGNPPYAIVGKGEIDCRTTQIEVWSMAVRDGEDVDDIDPCPNSDPDGTSEPTLCRRERG